ncbi:50S ribosomal protein L13 [Candidatus Woesearchaeota archaeon]|nr:50S ribosomal protein L13 [Candidatus Woesearchaeota archaeon]
MNELNLDATDAIIGRLMSYAAKQALFGNKVNMFNVEKALMSGSLEYNFERYHHLIKYTGQYQRGPYIPKVADRFVKRLIRGMLPHKRQRGAEAYKRIMCYRGIPVEFKNKTLTTYEQSDKKRLNAVKFITIQQLCTKLGGR